MICKWCGHEKAWAVKDECMECLTAMAEVPAIEWGEYVAYIRAVGRGEETMDEPEARPYGLTAKGEFIVAGGSEYLYERYAKDIEKDAARNWPERALEAQIS